jgi:hypothetical protein
MDNLPPITDEVLDECDALFTSSAWEGKAANEAEWRSQGQAVAWIDLKPTYVDCCAWGLFVPLPEPDHACIRIMRFVLLGGGQIRVQEKFAGPEHSVMQLDHNRNLDCPQCWDVFHYGRRLLIQAETGLVKVSGRLQG